MTALILKTYFSFFKLKFFDLLRYCPNLSEYYQYCLEFSQFMCGPTFLSCAKNRKIILLLIASTKSQIIKTNNLFLCKKLLVLLPLNNSSEYQYEFLWNACIRAKIIYQDASTFHLIAKVFPCCKPICY